MIDCMEKIGLCLHHSVLHFGETSMCLNHCANKGKTKENGFIY